MLEQKDRDEVIEIARRLVRIQSHHQTIGGEKAVGDALIEIARREGLAISREEITKDRFNVEIILHGDQPGKRLLYCGHLDTVTPTGMTIDPFGGYVEGGKLWGRGSVDMKGGLAAMLFALIWWKRKGASLKGTVTLIGTVGEECPNQSEGAFALRRRGAFADMAVIGEATQLNIAAAHKGTLSLEVTIRGKAAHSSNPSLGDNAIYKAARFISTLEDQLLKDLAKKAHPLCGQATMNVGVIQGGIQNNIVPDQCTFSLNRRYLPGETEEAIIKEIENVWDSLPYPKVDMTVSVLTETMNRIPLETDTEEEIVNKLVEVCNGMGVGGSVYGANYWTDGAHLRVAGIPTVVFGPGDIAQAHAAEEYIDLEQLCQGAEAYIRLIGEILG